jgi:hypothetical protein
MIQFVQGDEMFATLHNGWQLQSSQEGGETCVTLNGACQQMRLNSG